MENINKEGYIDEWFVKGKFQNRGIGKELLNELIAEFTKWGATHLAVDTHFETDSIVELYEYLGFTKRTINFFKPLE